MIHWARFKQGLPDGNVDVGLEFEKPMGVPLNWECGKQGPE
jgi:hypothetical protein